MREEDVISESTVESGVQDRDTFELTMRLRNNLLKSRRIEMGMVCKQIAKAVGISYFTYLELENMRASPRKKNGDWREPALSISKYLGISPDLLWPVSVQAITNPVVTDTIDEAKLLTLMAVTPELLLGGAPEDPHAACEDDERALMVRKVLRSLSPREQKVVCMRFGIGEKSEYTYEEIGCDFEVSKERIRQIENKALRKLRSRGRREILMEFHDEDAVREFATSNGHWRCFNSDACEYERIISRGGPEMGTVSVRVTESKDDHDGAYIPVAWKLVSTPAALVEWTSHYSEVSSRFFVHWKGPSVLNSQRGMMEVWNR